MPLESEPNTDNMENSSPGKNSSFAIENVLTCPSCMYVYKLFKITQEFVTGAAGLCCHRDQ